MKFERLEHLLAIAEELEELQGIESDKAYWIAAKLRAFVDREKAEIRKRQAAPSEARAEAARRNGARGGRPKREREDD